MNKGFTLIELLVTIVILTVLLLVTVPVVSNIITSSKEKAYAETKKNIEGAAELYFLRHVSEFPTGLGERGFVSVQKLKDAGLLKSNITDPRDGSAIVYGDVSVEIDARGGNDYFFIPTNIVKPGLVLWLDGEDFSNSPTTTNWIDESGNNNYGTPSSFAYTISSGLKSKGIVAFDGTDYVNFTTPINLGTNWTIDVNLKYITNSKTFEFFLGTNDNTGLYGKILLRYNGNITYSYPIGTYNNFNVLTSEINNTIKTLTFVSNGVDVKLYVDGSLRDTKVIANSVFIVSNLGNAWSDTAWTTKFDLYNLRIYNKALTGVEVLQNFNAN